MNKLELQAAAARQYFDEAAPAWDYKRHPGEETHARILTTIGMQPDCRILDVACGTGVLFKSLLQYTPALLRAVDISPAMAGIAAAKHPEPNVRVTAEDFYGFRETGFDYVMVYNAYPHFADKAAFGQAARGCLAAGGRLTIAHGAGRDFINKRHMHAHVRDISVSLGSCMEEAARLGSGFRPDILVDTPDIYILSGTFCGA